MLLEAVLEPLLAGVLVVAPFGRSLVDRNPFHDLCDIQLFRRAWACARGAYHGGEHALAVGSVQAALLLHVASPTASSCPLKCLLGYQMVALVRPLADSIATPRKTRHAHRLEIQPCSIVPFEDPYHLEAPRKG